MSVRVSFPFVLILIAVGLAGLNQCAIGRDHLAAPGQRENVRQAQWPKTFELVFDDRNGKSIPASENSDLLGPNLSFTTPACSRLKFAAERSGETFAGHLIRQRMRFGACARFLASGGKFWDWPWQRGLPRADLPPHERGQFGPWQLRCEDRAATRRCALVQIIRPDGAHGAAIITHFTMARFFGKLVPVWRVFAFRKDQTWYSGLTPEEARGWEKFVSRCLRQKEAFSKCMRGARDRFKGGKTKEVWIGLGQTLRNLKFTKCIASGCMIEAPIEMAARAYRQLGNGNNVHLKLHPLADTPVRMQVRADGFSQALEAFSNIDRTRISVQAADEQGAL